MMSELKMNTSTNSNASYTWAECLHCMEGGSDIISVPSTKAAPPTKTILWPGLLISLALMLSALLLSELPLPPFTIAGGRHPIDPVTLAIIFGMMISNVWTLPKSCQAGIKFAIKKVLPLGIILLGVRLNFLSIVRVRGEGLLLSLLTIVPALGLFLIFTRWLHLPGKLGTLLGVGTAICGGSAIVAVAPVIEAEEKDVVFGVATMSLLGLVGMFILPVIGHWLALDPRAFGIWAGLAIHQTPQVVAAGFASGTQAGETAPIVKLARVCLLAPVVFGIAVIYARRKASQSGNGKKIHYSKLFPTFVLGFLATALLQTIGWIPDLTVQLSNAAWVGEGALKLNLATVCEQVSKLCIVASMAAVGLETKLSAMKRTGIKPLAAGFAASLIIGALILGLIEWAGIR